MTTYEITSSSTYKIMTPLLKAKKIGGISYQQTPSISTTEFNSYQNQQHQSYTPFNEKANEPVYYKSTDYKPIGDQFNYNQDCTETEDYCSIKRERDDALSEIVRLKECNKRLSCDYADAVMKLKDYEKTICDLEKVVVILEGYKSSYEQIEMTIAQYQFELTKANEHIEELMSLNLQLENTNKNLMDDLKGRNIGIMQGKPIKKKNRHAHSNSQQIQKGRYDNASTMALKCHLEKENSEMNRKVDELEQQLDHYLQQNSIAIDKSNQGDTINHNNSHKESLELIINTLFSFVNAINDLFKREHISKEDCTQEGGLIKLASALDDLLNVLYASLVQSHPTSEGQ